MRILNRLMIALALLISIGIIFFSINILGIENKESAAIIAAALAVLTSAYSSWSAQRILEMQEDSLKPYPYPFIDITSRPGIMMFRVKNFGSTVACDIELVWDNGKHFDFHRDPGEPDITVLMPGEIISYNRNIGDSDQDLSRAITGTINFKDAAGRKMSHKFVVSLAQYAYSEKVDNEKSITNMEVQRIPRELNNLVGQVSRLRDTLENILGKK